MRARNGDPMSRKDDLEALENGKPFIRGALAFLVYLVKAKDKAQIDDCYVAADIFLKHLEEDLGGASKTGA